MTVLLASRLTPSQLEEAADTVHRLHRRFGIPEAGPIDHAGLQHEWVKSLNAIAFVHLSALGLAPDAVYDGYADYLTGVGPSLADVPSGDTCQRIISAMRAAHDTFASNKQLARTFKFTFTSLGPARTAQDAARTRIDCMNELRRRLEARLTGHAPTIGQTLAMGLDSLSYERARAVLTAAESRSLSHRSRRTRGT
ncbi:hypothetical protein ACH4GK_38025 [Streptomyces rimosus]|uniref:hypothetical protein n=1 Tax=Streptomyces rimosus TaxID=1927 RepID=UPI00131ACF2A|nr:hypothetical protein [Streptomyces rimosus]